MADFDAIVIGAGHNGMVCALYLARAGWRVAILERNNEPGGGLRSGAVTLPGFCHDRYATNVGLFAASPAFRELKPEFEREGLRLLRSDKPYASVYPGHALRIYTDAARTEAEFAAQSPIDATGWRQLNHFFQRISPHFLPLFFTELPSAQMWSQIGRLLSTGPNNSLRLAHLLFGTSRSFASEFFESREARGLLEAWAYHLDFGPDVRGGAVFAFVSALSSYVFGMPLVEGGAGRITTILRSLLEQAGVELFFSTEAKRILVYNGGVRAVRTAPGEEFATHAVVANISPRKLFLEMLDPNALSPSFLRRTTRYRYGPATFILHLALDRPTVWKVADDLGSFSYVHLNGSETELAATYRDSLRGFLPARPLLVVSQTTSLDPSRAPAGKHVMRVHVRTVPPTIEGDAAGAISARDWAAAKGPFAERILNLVSEHAPEIRKDIIGMAIESPDEIEQNNPNFVGGDCVAGSHHFDQNFFCRPFFGWSRYVTPVDRLYMIGASTWPGGGISAASGYLLARKLLNKH